MGSIVLLAQSPNDGAAGAFVGGFLSMMLVVWILGIASSLFWIWMIVDILVSKRETNDKILWFLVVFFLHFVGALIYFFVARERSGSVAGATT